MVVAPGSKGTGSLALSIIRHLLQRFFKHKRAVKHELLRISVCPHACCYILLHTSEQGISFLESKRPIEQPPGAGRLEVFGWAWHDIQVQCPDPSTRTSNSSSSRQSTAWTPHWQATQLKKRKKRPCTVKTNGRTTR